MTSLPESRALELNNASTSDVSVARDFLESSRRTLEGAQHHGGLGAERIPEEAEDVPLLGERPKETPFPWRPIIVVSLLQLCEAFQISILFPYAPFMVESFPGISKEQVGTYAGLLTAAFPLGQFLLSFVWGRVADRYGSKVVSMTAVTSAMCLHLVVGTAPVYSVALAARFATGLMNGNLGAMKAYLAKNTDSTNSKAAFGALSVAWNIGTILAPALGGFLSNPAEKYPNAFPPGSLFDRFPYLAPSLVSACMLALNLPIIYWVMQEKVEKKADGAGPVQKREYSKAPMWWGLASYGLMCFTYIMLDETYPLFAKTELAHNGLGFNSDQIGLALSAMGAFVSFYAFFVFPRQSKLYSNLLAARWGMLASIALFWLYPSMHDIAEYDKTWLTWVYMLAIMCMRGVFNLTAFTGIIILSNNAVAPEDLGYANGIGQTFASGARAAGPALAGIIWSSTQFADFPAARWVPWIMMTVFGLITMGATFGLPNDMELSFKEREDKARQDQV
eukprot:Clim_evm101s134 gene=Clim_evmTU101s134